jgi:hypothetical protein
MLQTSPGGLKNGKVNHSGREKAGNVDAYGINGQAVSGDLQARQFTFANNVKHG